jgi:hypothetical protein
MHSQGYSDPNMWGLLIFPAIAFLFAILPCWLKSRASKRERQS